MRQCQEDDVNLFVYLVPEIYTNFPKASIGNVDLLYLVSSGFLISFMRFKLLKKCDNWKEIEKVKRITFIL